MTTKVTGSVLANTAVTAGTYGGASQMAVVTVDAQGRLTSAANATPSIATSQLTGTISETQLSNTIVYGAKTNASALQGTISETQVSNTIVYGIKTNTSALQGTINATQVANSQSYGINITGSAGSATGAAASLSSGLWTVTASGTKLTFSYNSVAVFSVDSSGNIIAKADVSAYGTP